MATIGTRVIAISHTSGNDAFIFGYGTYEGDKKPSDFSPEDQPAGMMGQIITEEGMENPCIKLDDGKYVWGCECWWGPEDKAAANLKGYEIKTTDIREVRKAMKQP